MKTINDNKMMNEREQSIMRLLEIQKKLQEKKEQIRLQNSYEFINAKLTRSDRQRCNLNRPSRAFKSKTSHVNCSL